MFYDISLGNIFHWLFRVIDGIMFLLQEGGAVYYGLNVD